MGGFGSGRQGGRPTVESALRLDIDALVRAEVIRSRTRVTGEMTFQFYGDDLRISFETSVVNRWNNWIRLQYEMFDYWTGERRDIDDKVYLVASQPRFGGQRWWFLCPRENRRVRMLYLPLGGHHFRSRQAWRLAYASQRETAYDRAIRRSHKLCYRLGGDPSDDCYPEKPPRMRWATYDRLIDSLIAADHIADEHLLRLILKLGNLS